MPCRACVWWLASLVNSEGGSRPRLSAACMYQADEMQATCLM